MSLKLLEHNNQLKIKNIHFASPRVGDKKYSELIDNLIHCTSNYDSIRIYNRLDPVINFPFYLNF